MDCNKTISQSKWLRHYILQTNKNGQVSINHHDKYLSTSASQQNGIVPIFTNKIFRDNEEIKSYTYQANIHIRTFNTDSETHDYRLETIITKTWFDVMLQMINIVNIKTKEGIESV